MTDKVIKFYSKNAAENPDAVLEQAIGQYQDVLIIGWDKDGNFDPRANVGMTGTEMLWLIEQFKLNLLNGEYEE